jgi:DNA mismatch repair protein MutL
MSSFDSIRQSFASSKPASAPKQYSEISFNNKASSVRDSLLFSQEVLQNAFSSQSTESSLQDNEKETSSIRNIFQIFNKYIVIEFEDDHLWIVDQHAAAERINFEKLTNRETKSNVQTLLVPHKVKLTKDRLLFLEEHKEFFESAGFTFNIKDYGIDILTTPTEFIFDIQTMFNEIFEISDNPMILKQNFDRLKQDILAKIACHLSIRSGQKLDKSEMLNMYNDLSKCKNEYSCPHGRPVIWKMSLVDIDKNFERTY